MVPDPFAGRLHALRKKMESLALDAVLVTVPENRYYLSGFEAEDMNLTESSGQLLIGFDRQALLTDFDTKNRPRGKLRAMSSWCTGRAGPRCCPMCFDPSVSVGWAWKPII